MTNKKSCERTVRSARAMAALALQGWKPLQWSKIGGARHYAALIMSPPPEALALRSKERRLLFHRVICGAVTSVTKPVPGNELGPPDRLGSVETPWSPEALEAYQGIERELGPRPVTTNPVADRQRRLTELFRAHGLDPLTVERAARDLLQEHGLDSESLQRRREALLREHNLL